MDEEEESARISCGSFVGSAHLQEVLVTWSYSGKKVTRLKENMRWNAKGLKLSDVKRVKLEIWASGYKLNILINYENFQKSKDEWDVCFYSERLTHDEEARVTFFEITLHL